MNTQTHVAARFALDPEVRFLNHGSFGACPREVLDAQARLREQLEAEPVRFFVREAPALLDRARAAMAGLLHADPADLVFVPNATAGVNSVLRSYPLRPGDALLTTDHAYNACANALRFVAERAGARVDVAPVPFPLADEDAIVDAVLAGVRDDTRLVLLDWITSPTALVMPMARLVSELHARGIEVLVDGAHAPGQIEVDLTALDADYVTGNFHKWLCAPKSAAFLWVRSELQSRVRPLAISHGANAPLTSRSRFQVEFDWTGTDDPTAVLVLPEALAAMEALHPGGLAGLRAANHDLACWARDRLCEVLHVPAPAPNALLGAMAAVPLPDGARTARRGSHDTDPLQDRLLFDHRTEVPIVSWPSPPRRLIRVSAQAYNRRADYEPLFAALPGLLADEAAGAG